MSKLTLIACAWLAVIFVAASKEVDVTAQAKAQDTNTSETHVETGYSDQENNQRVNRVEPEPEVATTFSAYDPRQ